jgi:hypothetical protein
VTRFCRGPLVEIQVRDVCIGGALEYVAADEALARPALVAGAPAAPPEAAETVPATVLVTELVACADDWAG